MDNMKVPTLKFLTLVKIAVSLGNQKTTITAFSDMYSALPYRYALLEEKEVGLSMLEYLRDQANHLHIPNSLKKTLDHHIVAVTFRMLQWLRYHKFTFFISKLPNCLIWTAQGTIDKAETARILVNDDSISKLQRYDVACLYCLEDEIKKLFEHLNINFFEPGNGLGHLMISFWTHYVAQKLDLLASLKSRYCSSSTASDYEFAFRLSVSTANEVASRFFFEKLTAEEKERLLVEVAEKEANLRSWRDRYVFTDFSDTLHFIISVMNNDQIRELLKKRPFEKLEYLLVWPWQTEFVTLVERMLDFLPKGSFLKAAQLIADIISMEQWWYKDYDYQKLYVELYSRCSPSSGVILSATAYKMFLILSERGDEICISIMLRSARVAEKRRLIFSHKGKAICEKLLRYSHTGLLKTFISECISSQEKLLKLRKQFNAYKSRSKCQTEACMWNTAIRLTYNIPNCVERLEEEGRM